MDMTPDREADYVERLCTAGREAEEDFGILAAELARTPGWRVLACMRLRRRAQEMLAVIADTRREAERITANWECG